MAQRSPRDGRTTRTELRLLSGFTVTHEAKALQLKPAAQRLVGFLALLHRPVERRYAAVQLWPDKDDDRAMGNLRCALWRIRLLPIALVDTTPTHLRLSDAVWVDIRHGLEDGALVTTLNDIGLVEELLPDWGDEWVVLERERLRQHLLHAIESAAERALRERRTREAIDLALRAISLEPLRESAHGLLIQAHISEGNQSEALRQYRLSTAMLEQALGIPPSPALCRLVAPLIGREPPVFAVLASRPPGWSDA